MQRRVRRRNSPPRAALYTAYAANVLDVHRARDAQSDAKSRSGALGCSGDIEVVNS